MQYFLSIFLFFIAFNAVSQGKPPKKDVSMMTGQTLEKNVRVVKVKPSKEEKKESLKKLVTIYRKDAKNLLLGNFCAEAAMENFGVEYVIMPPNQTNLPKIKIFFRNFKGHFKMFFKKGPFWQKRLKKRIIECGYSTGDLPN